MWSRGARARRSVDRRVTPHKIGRALDSREVGRDGFGSFSQREREMRIIGLWGCARRALVDHQVAAASLDRLLEAFDRFLDLGELLGPFRSAEHDAERVEARGGLL
jgi:hypothetical protein